MENINKSQATIATILVVLEERGLQESAFAFGFNDLGLDDTFKSHFKLSMRWLKQHGYITWSNEQNGIDEFCASNPYLTERGLQLLGRSMIDGDHRTVRTILRELVERLKNGTIDAAAAQGVEAVVTAIQSSGS